MRLDVSELHQYTYVHSASNAFYTNPNPFLSRYDFQYPSYKYMYALKNDLPCLPITNLCEIVMSMSACSRASHYIGTWHSSSARYLRETPSRKPKTPDATQLHVLPKNHFQQHVLFLP